MSPARPVGAADVIGTLAVSTSNVAMDPNLAPDRLLTAYAMGIFPMADEFGEIHWLAPDPRCIIELDRFQVSRSLRSVVRRGVFQTTVDRAFEQVIDACADRPYDPGASGEITTAGGTDANEAASGGTWISPEIRRAYVRLHALGFAHSVESWRGGRLVGGLYGVAIGGAFFGESMFYRETDASKVALVALVERMRKRGYVLLDTQFMTEHLRQFGAVEISREAYERRLEAALVRECTFADDAEPSAPPESGRQRR